MSDGMSYIGRESCGHVTCATVDAPEYRRDVARELAKWVRWGLSVERVTVEEARTLLLHPDHEKCRAAAKATKRAGTVSAA